MDHFSIMASSLRRLAYGATMGVFAGSFKRDQRRSTMKTARSLIAVAVMLIGVSAYPQNPQSWTVNVPFDFTVRHINLEAGRYTVQQSGQTIFLTSRNGRAAC